MARRVKLTRYGIRPANHQHIRGFRLRVVAEAVDMDPNVFVFRRNGADPVTGVAADEYMTVAGLTDMSEYPVGAPNPALGLPNFRRSGVELDVRSAAEHDMIWRTIVAEVDALRVALDLADHLTIEEVFWSGGEPLPGESESLSGGA